jgi:predicted DNA-binding protein
MTRPTTLRLPDDLLRELDTRAKARGKDRASFLREMLRKGLTRDAEEEVLTLYAAGRLSLTEAAARLHVDLWELLDRFRQSNIKLNVSLEDWMDARPSLR